MPPWLFVTLSFSGSMGLATVQHVVWVAGEAVVPGRSSLSSAPSVLLLVLVGCCGSWLEFLRGLMCFWLSPSVMTRGTAFSPSYRFTLSDGTVLSAHTKCKLCYPSSPEMQPFIMGIHVIDRYVPTVPLPSHASAQVGDPGIKEPVPSSGRRIHWWSVMLVWRCDPHEESEAENQRDGSSVALGCSCFAKRWPREFRWRFIVVLQISALLWRT